MFRVLISILLLLPVLAFSQVKTVGVPNIQNYPKSEYKAGTQNWDIAQDDYGFMYFANNEGVLRFDGINWELIPIPLASPVRSIIIDSNNRIFVGMMNDFGIIEQNENGQFEYQSLKHLIPESVQSFTEIWRIHEIKQGIVFQCFEYAFIYNEQNINIIHPKEKFLFSFNVNGRLFLHERGVGLFEYFSWSAEQLPWANLLKDMEIRTILQISENQLLIGTVSHGFYQYNRGVLSKWETPASKFVEQYKLYSSTVLPGNYYAFGTILGGIIFSDNSGNILQQVSREKGLKNNTVLDVFADKDANLWLGLDNGIDYLEINSPMSFITMEEGIGTGYTSCIYNDRLYLGTNQGVFYRNFNPGQANNYEPFKLINNTAGQVWSLSVADGQLLCGHNLGTYLIEDGEARKISDEAGAWKYIEVKTNPDFLIGGHYNGLVLLKKEKLGWTYHKKIKGFNESSRFLCQDANGDIWVSHDGKGVYCISLNADLDSVVNTKQYTMESGLPADEHNIVLEVEDKWYVSGVDGLYEYEATADSFVKANDLNQVIDINERIKSIEKDRDNNLWYISENESGVIHKNEDNTYTKITTPFKQLKDRFVNAFEFLYPYSTEHVFFGIENGFAHYSSRVAKSYTDSFNAYITKIEVNSLDSIIAMPFLGNNTYEFPFIDNSFRFYYAATSYENPKALMFSYFLENYSDGWSSWSSDTYRDFNNLRENDYVFKLKARNIYGVESEVATFKFTIRAPWYRSNFAYYTYIFLILLLVFAVTYLVQKRIERSKINERLKHQRELEQREKEFEQQALLTDKKIMKLRNDKLRTEKVYLDKELANQTMSIIQKNKFLMKLNQELNRVQDQTSDNSVKTKMAILKKRIDKEIDSEQQNKVFESYFDEVHVDFFTRLKETYPQLSPKDLRLSAYIRMNISTKEIATLLNISDRGVEISRYRLRKKMELSREVNLSTFLSNI